MSLRVLLRSRKQNLQENQNGFTILELMIATTIFSLVLMGCLAGIIQITRMYYRGVTQIRTQEVVRALADEIGESIRFSSKTIYEPPPPTTPSVSDPNDSPQFICIGSKRYSYYIDKQLQLAPEIGIGQRRHVLWVDQPALDCNSTETVAADLDSETPSNEGNGIELLAENMRLTSFSIEPFPGNDDVYRVDITVVYGDNDLIKYEVDGSVTCKSGFVGSEFCAVSSISLIVERRL